MKKARTSSSSGSGNQKRPALSLESRQSQMVALAVDLAEKQLIEGTASSQVITHYLKLGTVQAQLEKEKLENENKLLRAKTQALESVQRSEELFEKAIAAMKAYSGNGDESDEY